MTTSGITNINAKLIHQHPDNPRKDLGDLTELSESIKKKGIMQNLTVIPGYWDEKRTHHEEGYTLIIGHRRFAAGKMAGVTMYPCRIVEDMSYTKRSPKMEQLSVEDWKPDACPKNVTVEEYLATFPKIKLTRREYLQTIPLYHAALYLAETTQKVHSSQEWYLYLNEKVDQNGEVLSGEYDVSETN